MAFFINTGNLAGAAMAAANKRRSSGGRDDSSHYGFKSLTMPYESPTAVSRANSSSPRVSPLNRSADEQLLRQQIEETHTPDGTHIEVRPFFNLVEDILVRATQVLKPGKDEASKETKGITSMVTSSVDFDSAPDLPLLIERVSCEMGCKCLGGSCNTHEATLSILKLLNHHTWEAKLVITLAAFALNYGEFLLLSQVYPTNPLAQSMALLKQLPETMSHPETLSKQFDATNALISAMLGIARLMIELNEVPSDYIAPQENSIQAAMSSFPMAVYWTVKSAVATATQISLIATNSHGYMPSMELELSPFLGKLKFVQDFLEKIKLHVEQMIEESKEEEAYQKIRKSVFNMVHPDNLPNLKAIIYSKDDILPLYDGSTKSRAKLDVLQGTTVLLLVTGLDINNNELSMLEKIYNESKTHAYSIVWVPIVDRSIKWNDDLQTQFERAQRTMPWYSVHHPSIISNAAIRFIQVDLNFKGKPVLVALDSKGAVASTNAFHMMWVWKNEAFPFTLAKEDAMWRQETWRLELLVDTIDQRVMDWIKDDKYTIIYGGDDIEWIRNFTKVAKEVSQKSNVNLEMMYVGKSCKKEASQKITKTLEAENLGSYLKDTTDMWFFWTRLESMLHSKIQLNKVDDDDDKSTQEIKKLLSYDKNVGAWAVLAKGSEIVVSLEGSTFYEVLCKYEEWKIRVGQMGFLIAFLENVPKLPKPDHCCRFEFPTTIGKIPEKMKCPECHNSMGMNITFVCCHEGAMGVNMTKVTPTGHLLASAT